MVASQEKTCLETVEELSKVLEDLRSELPLDQRVHEKCCEDHMKGGYTVCNGINAQGFICLGLPSGSIPFEVTMLLYFLLNYLFL